ncbi:hypothetical protein E2C01_058716 [Portunus trituberculatus]|uniref:Uncharacterized protein n=1 Tax=Portunus trituberculatus TaxID=210409 RepID=A0A5B7H678_PORTR|nr:hypothetical protein [Portunus trituberculatus]
MLKQCSVGVRSKCTCLGSVCVRVFIYFFFQVNWLYVYKKLSYSTKVGAGVKVCSKESCTHTLSIRYVRDSPGSHLKINPSLAQPLRDPADKKKKMCIATPGTETNSPSRPTSRIFHVSG